MYERVLSALYIGSYFQRQVVVVVCYCSHINSHDQVRGHRTGSSHSGAEEYPQGKNTNKPKVVHAYTYITADAIHASARKIQKNEFESQPTMCQVHTCAHVSILAPEKTDYTACHSEKTTTFQEYITRSTYHYTYARQTQVN